MRPSVQPPEAPKKKRSIFEMPKKDASTSCNDLFKLDSPLCDQVCFKNMIVETYTQEVAMENEQLKQDVARLTKDLIQKKGTTEQAQPHQDNTIKEVKKLDEGQTVVCSCATMKATSPMSAR